MPTQIGELSFKVESSAERAVKGIDSLTESLTKLRSATKGKWGSGLDSIKSQLEGLAQASDGKSVEKLTALSDALSKLSGVTVNAGIGTQLNRIGKSVNTLDRDHVNMLGDMVRDLKELSSLSGFTIPNLKGLSSASTQAFKARNGAIIEDAGSMGSEEATPAPNAGTVNRELNKTVSILNRIKTASLTAFTALKNGLLKAKIGANNVKMALSKIHKAANSIRTFGGLIGKTNSGLGKLLRSFTRIAAYRAIRSFFSTLSKMMTEGINNLYRYSSALGGTFAASMDRLATSFLYLKNSLGAMVSPIINAIAPAVDFLIDKFVDLLNIINMVFSRLTGATTFTKAKKQATSYGDAIGGAGKAAGKAAKEIEDATIGIDELNIIHEDDAGGSGGGSGGGGTALNYADMFETATIDSAVADFVERIKEAFRTNDWSGIGTEIGKKVNEAVKKVPWDDIGENVGKGINGAITISYDFAKELNATDIGANIASGLNTMLDKINFKNLGGLLVRTVTLPIDLAIGFMSEFDTHLLAGKISDFVTGAFTEASRWLDSHDWEGIGDTIWEKVKGFITGIKWDEVASSLATFAGKAVRSALQLLWGFLKGIGTDIRNWFEREIIGDNWEETITNLAHALEKWFDKLGELLVDIVINSFLRGLLGDELMDKIANWTPPWSMSYEEAQSYIDTYSNGETPTIDKRGVEIDLEIEGGFKTVTDWLASPGVIGPAISKLIGLGKETKGESRWSTMSEYIGRYKGDSVAAPVRLTRLPADENGYKKWTTVGNWITTNFMGGAIGKAIDLIKGGQFAGRTVAEWVNLFKGGDVNKNVMLNRGGGFAGRNVLQWIQKFYNGGNVEKGVVLGRAGGFAGRSVLGWINYYFLGGNVNKGVDLIRAGGFKDRSVTGWVNKYFLGGNVTKGTELYRSGWSDVGSWVNIYKGGVVGSAIGLYRNGWSTVGNWVDAVSGGDDSVSVAVDLHPTWFGSLANRIRGWLGLEGGGWVDSEGTMWFAKELANGGIVQAKGGMTAHHGSMFVAGESGAEMVGHLGGRTEVMNRFQIASVMRTAITDAIHMITPTIRGVASQSVDNANGIINAVLVTAEDMNRNLANLDTFGAGAYMTQRSYDTASQASDDDGQDMNSVLRNWYETYLNPQLSKIATDTERQADKNEQMVVNLDGRTLAKSVNTANKRMGYTFAV